MTIRDLLRVLIRAEDLDAMITVATDDRANLGPICSADIGYMRNTGVMTPPRLVLTLASADVAVLSTCHARRQADGDPEALEKLRKAGVIS